MHGYAVSVGHLQLINKWRDDNMEIILILKGDDFNRAQDRVH